jgi:hypothetical protein
MQALQNQNREQWRTLLAEGMTSEKFRLMQAPTEPGPVITSFAIRSVTVNGNQARVRIFWERANRRTGQPLRGYGFNHLSMGLTFAQGRWGVLWLWAAEIEFASALFNALSENERRQLLAQEPELDAGEAVIRLAIVSTQRGVTNRPKKP